ncbi:DUF2303 family protein [Microbacterium sp. STF-2]|uniref:DUF2303 family protein n=1 Tax=Microbacterium sp. STF-2 TaxID=3031132 RepID=UPI002AFE0502|nr:DUF2303 family protein [Microbacterium sp. STF-2]MEA1264217.1 DUF2303 family protein [Microbacterium sp. STF-2]
MTTIEDTKTDAAVVAELADQAAENQRVAIATGEVYLVRGDEGELRLIDTDSYAEHPRHEAAARSVTDAESFVKYVNRHALDGTEVYAHINSSKVIAVIDSHESTGGEPGWQKHRVSLDLEHSKAWLAWAAADGKLATQEEFADFLDDRYLDVIEPTPAQMIDIARTFQAKTKVNFESGVRETSGEVKLTYQEETTAKAGQKGDIEIPSRIQLALRPYVGGPIYSIWASFRYRLRGGSVVLGFKLERPELILEAAFADIVSEIRDGKTDKRPNADSSELVETRVHDGIGDVPIFYGRPAA